MGRRDLGTLSGPAGDYREREYSDRATTNMTVTVTMAETADNKGRDMSIYWEEQ